MDTQADRNPTREIKFRLNRPHALDNFSKTTVILSLFSELDRNLTEDFVQTIFNFKTEGLSFPTNGGRAERTAYWLS